METKKSIIDSMSDSLNNLNGGFYYNPDDKRLFVPKSIPLMGYTMNFGQPLAYVVILGLIVAIIAIAIFLS